MQNHPLRKLYHDIDISTMREMREQGMSNREIALACGASVPTVYKYLGAQGFRKKKKSPAISDSSLASVGWETSHQIQRLTIGWRTYDVDVTEQKVSIPYSLPRYLTAEDVHNMARELACIDEMLQKGAKACKQS